MKRSEAFPSNYLGKDDVPKPFVAVIASVTIGEIKGEHGTENKPIMHFAGGVKPMILNNANWITCESAYGPDSDDWNGKKVEVYVDTNIMFGAKRVGGVRLRLPIGAPADDPNVWLFPQAIAECAKVGITVDQLKAGLKKAGLTAYNAIRDTATVKAFIASVVEPSLDAPAELTPGYDHGNDEPIPF